MDKEPRRWTWIDLIAWLSAGWLLGASIGLIWRAVF